jgi:hypothetical protein
MTRLLPAAFAIALFLAACSDDSDPEDGASTETPTALRTTETPLTGITELDELIDAVLSGDSTQLRSVTAFQSMACTATPVGIGPFYCDEGEANGTVSDVIPIAQCEGSFIRKEDFALADETLSLYAATQTDAGYRLVFSRLVGPERKDWGLALSVEGGRIVLVDFGCGDSPGEMLARLTSEDIVLPPLVEPTDAP